MAEDKDSLHPKLREARRHIERYPAGLVVARLLLQYLEELDGERRGESNIKVESPTKPGFIDPPRGFVTDVLLGIGAATVLYALIYTAILVIEALP